LNILCHISADFVGWWQTFLDMVHRVDRVETYIGKNVYICWTQLRQILKDLDSFWTSIPQILNILCHIALCFVSFIYIFRNDSIRYFNRFCADFEQIFNKFCTDYKQILNSFWTDIDQTLRRFCRDRWHSLTLFWSRFEHIVDTFLAEHRQLYYIFWAYFWAHTNST